MATQATPGGAGVRSGPTRQQPFATFVKEDHVRWRIELSDLRAVRDLLGPELLNAFCRCSVHADRLRGVIDVTYLCKMNYRDGTPGAMRNLEALATFGSQTLSNLIAAMSTLFDAAVRGALDRSAAPWPHLEAFVNRWERDRVYGKLRHADLSNEGVLVDRGLSGLAAEQHVTLCQGRGAILQQSSCVLGPRAWAIGSGVTEADVDSFLVALSEHGSLATMLQEAFVLTLQTKGVPLHESSGTSGSPVGERA